MDTSVLTIVFLYSSFILVYFDIFKNFKELKPFKRFVVPALATIGALYLIYGAFTSSPLMFLYFSIIVLLILAAGYVTYQKPVKKSEPVLSESVAFNES